MNHLHFGDGSNLSWKQAIVIENFLQVNAKIMPEMTKSSS
jgi:hypothetical protein